MKIEFIPITIGLFQLGLRLDRFSDEYSLTEYRYKLSIGLLIFTINIRFD